MQGIKVIILLVLFAAGLMGSAVSFAEEKANFVLCRNQKNVRTVHIDKSSDVYIASYTRFGVDKEDGRGRNYDSVLKIMENIKTNLEKSNWKCKEIYNVTSTVGK